MVHNLDIKVYDIKSLNLLASFACLDIISQIEWSPDSSKVLAAQDSRSIVQIFSITDLKWTSKIDLGQAGLESARWSPDSLSVLTISEFNLRLTIWNLVDKSSCFIPNPKHADRGLSFSQDGRFMALCMRRDNEDHIDIFSTSDWRLVSSFATCMTDLHDIAWLKDDTVIVCWDNPAEYKVAIYSPSGEE